MLDKPRWLARGFSPEMVRYFQIISTIVFEYYLHYIIIKLSSKEDKLDGFTNGKEVIERTKKETGEDLWRTVITSNTFYYYFI